MRKESQGGVWEGVLQGGQCRQVEESFPEPIGSDEEDVADMGEVNHPLGLSRYARGTLAAGGEPNRQAGEHPEERCLTHGIEIGVDPGLERERQ